MKRISILMMLLTALYSKGQTTASNFNANDCSGASHDLFDELNSGKVIVLCWVMPCSSCAGEAVSACNIVSTSTASHPGKVKLYLCDDYGNTSCATLNSWAAANGINYHASFSNSSIKMSDYGANGMPKTVVLGGGTSHRVYFNQNNGLNTANFTNAINSAIAGSALSYTIKPASTVSFTAPLNDLTISDIYQVNTGTSKIKLKWEKVSVDVPQEWQYSMCDLGTCHTGIPAGPTGMDSVPVGGQGFLGLNIDPGTMPGSGIVRAFVYQDGFKADGDTLTWYITAPPGTVGIEELLSGYLNVYPNPATDRLNIHLGDGKPAAYCYLSDPSGRIVRTYDLEKGNNKVNVSDLQPGFYILTVETQSKRFNRRITLE